MEQSGLSPSPSGGLLLAVDSILYLLIAALLLPIAGFARPRKCWRLFIASLILTILIDTFFWVFEVVDPASLEAFRSSIAGQLIELGSYMVPQILIYMSIAVADRHSEPGIWAVGGPLLVGTGFTWLMGVAMWPGLWNASIGREVGGEYFATPRVNQEYFAQVTQLLPVLLIALAVELRFFRGDSPTTAPSGGRQARAAVVAGIAGAGALAAVLALLRRDDEGVELNNLNLWFEYFAYVLTINAVSVTLVSLVWAFITDRVPAAKDSTPP